MTIFRYDFQFPIQKTHAILNFDEFAGMCSGIIPGHNEGRFTTGDLEFEFLNVRFPLCLVGNRSMIYGFYRFIDLFDNIEWSKDFCLVLRPLTLLR